MIKHFHFKVYLVKVNDPTVVESLRSLPLPCGREPSSSSGGDPDFDNFKIIVNSETIDPQLSKAIRLKYYKLCRSRDSYLHEGLLKTVDCTLATGIITCTVKVVDEIRDCEIGTSEGDFAKWERTLEGFEMLGMEVQFLRNILKRLANIGSDLRVEEEVKRYEKTNWKRDCMWEEMRSVEVKFKKLKEAAEKLEDERKSMKLSILRQKYSFQQQASVPW